MDNKKRIEKQIKQIELQLKKLCFTNSKNEVSESLQNSLILKKAVLKKELAGDEKKSIFSKFRKFLPNKKKLICDYFN